MQPVYKYLKVPWERQAASGAPNSAAGAKGVLERRTIKMTLQDLAGEDDANHDVFLKVCQWSNL